MQRGSFLNYTEIIEQGFSVCASGEAAAEIQDSGLSADDFRGGSVFFSPKNALAVAGCIAEELCAGTTLDEMIV